MATRFTCIKCGFTVDLNHGRYRACPKCGGQVRVTTLSESSHPTKPPYIDVPRKPKP